MRQLLCYRIYTSVAELMFACNLLKVISLTFVYCCDVLQDLILILIKYRTFSFFVIILVLANFCKGTDYDEDNPGNLHGKLL